MGSWNVLQPAEGVFSLLEKEELLSWDEGDVGRVMVKINDENQQLLFCTGGVQECYSLGPGHCGVAGAGGEPRGAWTAALELPPAAAAGQRRHRRVWRAHDLRAGEG